jgi:hypothetical protein
MNIWLPTTQVRKFKLEEICLADCNLDKDSPEVQNEVKAVLREKVV